jgi:predicted naringenin-chalcone synthase
VPAVMLCVELPTLHVQPSTDPKDLPTVVSHALFADAAAAVVIEPDASGGLEILDTMAVTVPASAPLMTWEVTDHGFRMGLSPKVPSVLSGHVGDAVEALVKPHGLDVADVAGWAVHPGGRRIVDVVAEQLHLAAEQVAASRAVLDGYGNCSSPTVLMVLDEIRGASRSPPVTPWSQWPSAPASPSVPPSSAQPEPRHLLRGRWGRVVDGRAVIAEAVAAAWWA